MEWIANLPKLIDAFIVGAIEFLYRFFAAVLAMWRAPLASARELDRAEEQLSSRTMLFGSTALFTAIVIGIGNTAALDSVGLVHFLAMVIILYIALDLLAALLCAVSRKYSSDGQGALRCYLRYAFASTFVAAGVLSVIMVFLSYELALDPRAAASSPSTAVFLSTLILLLAVSYPAAYLLAELRAEHRARETLAGRPGPPDPARVRLSARDWLGCAGYTICLSIAVMGLAIFVVAGYPNFRALADGGIEIAHVDCFVEDGVLQIVAAGENTSRSGDVLAGQHFMVELLLPPAEGAEETTVAGEARLDGEVQLVQPMSLFKIEGTTYPQLAAGGNAPECRITHVASGSYATAPISR